MPEGAGFGMAALLHLGDGRLRFADFSKKFRARVRDIAVSPDNRKLDLADLRFDLPAAAATRIKMGAGPLCPGGGIGRRARFRF